MIPRVIMFDLDNTLAQSKQPIDEPMAVLLNELLARTKVAIISGGALGQLVAQAAERLAPPDSAAADHSAPTNLDNLYLLPTSGAALYKHGMQGAWTPVYEKRLTDEESARIEDALREGAEATGLIDFSHELHGPYIENRGAQVSLSALGQRAPVEEKQAWDPTHEKRKALQAAIAPLLPGYDVKVGGLTTIDVTAHGINKAFGVRSLSEHLEIPISEMLYIGDELSPGGNDDVVKETGIPTQSVENPRATARFLQDILSA